MIDFMILFKVNSITSYYYLFFKENIMTQICRNCIDKTSQRSIYGIINEYGKVIRFTFSKSLAMFLCTYDDTYTYHKFRFKVGDIANKESKNCVFAIVSYTGAVLRMATTYERAEVLVDNNYRFIFEAKIKLKYS